jgi:hypothetical protein
VSFVNRFFNFVRLKSLNFVRLYNFFNLFFMRLFQSYDSDREFDGLTRVFFLLFSLTFFFINFII